MKKMRFAKEMLQTFLMNISNNTLNTIKYKIVFNKEDAIPEETKWKYLNSGESVDVSNYKAFYPEAYVEFGPIPLQSLAIRDGGDVETRVSDDENMSVLENTSFEECENKTSDSNKEKSDKIECPSESRHGELIEDRDSDDDPGTLVAVSDHPSTVSVPEKFAFNFTDGSSITYECAPEFSPECAPEFSPESLSKPTSPNWEQLLEDFWETVESKNLTKSEIIKLWFEIREMCPDPKPFDEFLKAISSYPGGYCFTKRQLGRAYIAIYAMLSKPTKHNPQAFEAHRKSTKRRFVLPERNSSLSLEISNNSYLDTPKIKDCVVIEMVITVLSGNQNVLTSSLGIIFRDLLACVEIHTANENTDVSRESYFAVRDILSNNGYKFDGYEGFVEEPNFSKIKKEFEAAMNAI